MDLKAQNLLCERSFTKKVTRSPQLPSFLHACRSEGESWYGKVFSNIFALKDFVGVVDAQVLSDYVKTDWRDYRKQLLGRTREA